MNFPWDPQEAGVLLLLLLLMVMVPSEKMAITSRRACRAEKTMDVTEMQWGFEHES